MTRDDIIRMAREASGHDFMGVRTIEFAERFHAIAVAAERERCCAIVFGMAGSDNVAQRTVEKIREGQA